MQQVILNVLPVQHEGKSIFTTLVRKNHVIHIWLQIRSVIDH